MVVYYMTYAPVDVGPSDLNDKIPGSALSLTSKEGKDRARLQAVILQMSPDLVQISG